MVSLNNAPLRELKWGGMAYTHVSHFRIDVFCEINFLVNTLTLREAKTTALVLITSATGIVLSIPFK
jgi:hypothetical protein